MIIGREGKGQGKTPLFSSQIFEEADDVTHMYNVHNSTSLFRNKMFLVNLILMGNDSKFAMFMEKENPSSFFSFSFRATFIFPL